MSAFSKMKLAAFAMISGLVALPALAIAGVENGTYSGTTAGGSTVGFTVIGDPNNAGQHLVHGYNWAFTDTCPGGTTTTGGWSTGYSDGQGVPISKGKVAIVNGFALAYLSETEHFNGTTATGTITTVDPALVIPESGKPKKALKCASKSETFTATLATPSAAPADRAAFVGTVPLGQGALCPSDTSDAPASALRFHAAAAERRPPDANVPGDSVCQCGMAVCPKPAITTLRGISKRFAVSISAPA